MKIPLLLRGRVGVTAWTLSSELASEVSPEKKSLHYSQTLFATQTKLALRALASKDLGLFPNAKSISEGPRCPTVEDTLIATSKWDHKHL